MLKPFIIINFIACTYLLMAATIAPSITAAYDAKNKAVIIKWQQKVAGIKTFIIQRSDDNSEWTDIARQESVYFNASKVYQFLDYKAEEGQNYYRLKCITDQNTTEYAASIMVINGTVVGNWVIYPVPVGDMLTLQYKGITKISGVVNVFIHNINGRIITRVRSASINTIIRIPVNNLGKGIYDVRIIIEDEVVWNQRFLK